MRKVKVLCYFHTSFQWKDMAQTLVLFVFTAKHKRFSVPKQPPFMAFINFPEQPSKWSKISSACTLLKPYADSSSKEHGARGRNSLQGFVCRYGHSGIYAPSNPLRPYYIRYRHLPDGVSCLIGCRGWTGSRFSASARTPDGFLLRTASVSRFVLSVT